MLYKLDRIRSIFMQKYGPKLSITKTFKKFLENLLTYIGQNDIY